MGETQINNHNLKRITIHSELQLDVWLKKNAGVEERVVAVTHTKESHQKYVSIGEISTVLEKHDWKSETRYTIGSDLLGHVISKSQ